MIRKFSLDKGAIVTVVSVELKIIIHLPVSAIGYMSAVTTYFSALNIHFSGVTMDLRSLRIYQ